ncbi:hypothetical protein BU14_1280s0001 [Porphyra umbilicalis]|uniref:Uncharacterized protein n=1 Tax=Porphyra umbilicalis TaxID=2786 RepID=A0A1X6NM17_PORUM|nr:hypothetical protein BU14_1280s0001 [Porphyra umbilicalis]|eukprot:OSX69681.1 hypothetical protein BU14_1280s0001 [Porphyra umbilicalis]
MGSLTKRSASYPRWCATPTRRRSCRASWPSRRLPTTRPSASCAAWRRASARGSGKRRWRGAPSTARRRWRRCWRLSARPRGSRSSTPSPPSRLATARPRSWPRALTRRPPRWRRTGRRRCPSRGWPRRSRRSSSTATRRCGRRPRRWWWNSTGGCATACGRCSGAPKR